MLWEKHYLLHQVKYIHFFVFFDIKKIFLRFNLFIFFYNFLSKNAGDEVADAQAVSDILQRSACFIFTFVSFHRKIISRPFFVHYVIEYTR